jgi:hypothetical protein
MHVSHDLLVQREHKRLLVIENVDMLMVTAKVNLSDTIVARSARGPREACGILSRVSQHFPTIRQAILSKQKNYASEVPSVAISRVCTYE